MRLLKVTLLSIAILATFVLPSLAQMVLVDSSYYVTEMKPGKMEFGVALKRGEFTRNWVHVKSDTRINRRIWLGGGRGFRDNSISRDHLWTVLRLGMRVHVEGGRAWDGSVSARRIWF